MHRLLASFGALALAAAASAQPAAKVKATSEKIWTAPRTADGHPDLQGIWTNSTMTPLERPRDLAGKEFLTEQEASEREKKLREDLSTDRRDGGAEVDVNRSYNELWRERGKLLQRTSLIVDPPDGRLPPLTPEAQKREKARLEDRRRHPDMADSWEDRNLAERCITRGAPKLPGGYNNNFQIFQTKDYVAILQEMIHEVRFISLNGSPHVDKNLRLWMGDSRGHWEGDTLVVETIGFNDRTWLDLGGHTHSEALRTTERFRRRDLGHMEIQETFDDPQTFTKPWSITIPADLAIDIDVIEYICAENEKDIRHLVGKASETVEDAKKRAVKVAPEALAKYVGTYESHYLENPVTARLAHVTLKDGVLLGELSPAIPLSDTVFFWGGTRHEFVTNEQGVVTHMLEGENGNKAIRISGGN
jgi:hypothetical protein